MNSFYTTSAKWSRSPSWHTSSPKGTHFTPRWRRLPQDSSQCRKPLLLHGPHSFPFPSAEHATPPPPNDSPPRLQKRVTDSALSILAVWMTKTPHPANRHAREKCVWARTVGRGRGAPRCSKPGPQAPQCGTQGLFPNPVSLHPGWVSLAPTVTCSAACEVVPGLHSPGRARLDSTSEVPLSTFPLPSAPTVCPQPHWSSGSRHGRPVMGAVCELVLSFSRQGFQQEA